MLALEIGVELQAVLSDGLQMGAAGNARHVLPGQRQEAGYRAAYAARAYDQVFQCFFHIFIFKFADLHSFFYS
jgi:hypothetical protein